MIEQILIFVAFAWLVCLTVLFITMNGVIDTHEEILYILRDDINSIRFGDNDGER